MLLTTEKIVGHEQVFLQETDSTNHQLQMLLKSGPVKEGFTVSTAYQNGGRGQMGKQWHSLPGQNILMSFVLYPTFIRAEEQFYLSMAMSLGVYDFLAELIEGVSIKWPNDIMVNGQKICGMLIQNTLSGDSIASSVIGIGINVNQSQFEPELSHATSLKILTAKEYNLTACQLRLTDSIDERYKQLRARKFEALKADYLKHLFGMKEPHSFLIETQCVKGIIKGIDEYGCLLVEIEGNVLKFKNGEIGYIY
ncbi:MAG: biotin--[acetyl-CoA-carboxylase] ligase [Bacteroidota bacterium]|nr:biotin--[acetyl-CoA-carboxylase] ligase [Bacteroidota bacterium]